MKVKMSEALFFLIQQRCTRRWWLSDIGSGRGADEEFPLSSLTQGYGPIMLNAHFYFHHQLFSLSRCSNPILMANSGFCHSSHADNWSAWAVFTPAVLHNYQILPLVAVSTSNPNHTNEPLRAMTGRVCCSFGLYPNAYMGSYSFIIKAPWKSVWFESDYICNSSDNFRIT